ncbi:MAG TPA: O-antigen ligase family protein, partial [Polyangiaceae bacterium]
VVLTGSRGGVGSLALGGVALAFVVLRQQRPDWLRVGGAVSALLLVLLVVGIALAGPSVHEELLDSKLGAKATAWGWTLDLIRDFPVFGVGRGGFETAFQSYRQPLGRDWTTIFAHAENFPLEWLADWGVPVGLAAVAAVAFAASGVRRRALGEPLASGLAIGLATLLLQNLVDLGLEVFAITAAALVAYAGIQSPGNGERRASLRFALPVAGAVVGSVLVVATGATPVALERERVASDYRAFEKSGARDGSRLFAGLRASIRRHPADAYFPMMGALISSRTHQGDPMRWLARALERGPMNGTTHVVLAQVLASRGARKQALIHTRLAALYDVTLRDYALQQAILFARNTEELVSTFPAGLPGAELLEDLCEATPGERRIGCWREALSRRPSARARHRLTSSLLDSMENGEAPCAGEKGKTCATEVEWLVDSLRAGRPPDPRTADHRSRLLAFRGDFRLAAQAALDGCPASPEGERCLTRALDYAGRANNLEILGTVAERYLALRCTDAASCGAAEDTVGAKYVGANAWGLALKHSSAAAKAEPTTERWIRNAEAAAHAGSTMTARISLERANHAGGLDDGQRARVAIVETLLQQAPGGLH